ncbi:MULTISPECIES: hypothetical protein [Paenibacillus]|uniref:Uncharacterized protein n=1 Tax=Paenibacillus lactis 154 TaxID=743719 RepID=G4H9R0_9BACL|nr:hypothetical protein [Paenibacillus lactis]EHB68595.1 hypothetical protein PaelaDRAFT_0721 [Paenibacillus lactis 154]
MDIQYLFHYYEDSNGPFKNLSSLPLDEAKAVMKAIKAKGSVFASKRPENYLEVRFDLEEKARKLFIQKGGKPKMKYPHYMTLGRCKWLKEWYTTGEEIQIQISEFNPDILSFTYGDLFPTMRYKDGKPYREQIYTFHEIVKIIDEYGLPQAWNPDGDKGPERYIEVQVWDEEVLRKYM